MNNFKVSKQILILLVVGGLLTAADFFVVHFVFRVTSWEAWWAANVFHFFGGFYAFFFVRVVFEHTRDRHKIYAARWAEAAIFVLGAVFLGVLWEWFELAIDRYHVLIQGKQSIMFYADNIGDLILDFLGAALAGIYILGRRRK